VEFPDARYVVAERGAALRKVHMSAERQTKGPLEGLTVLDFSRVLAGPFATVLLADLGARVIKIEPPSGDDYRHIGPFKGKESMLFAFANRGKESIVLDLKRADDLAFVLELAAHADVAVENFRPGVADKLGVGASALRARNPRLIYASISGFGQMSPMRERPAYDLIVQALTGLMSITGEPDGPPTMLGEAFGDLTAGLFASWAILAALHQRERTGQGCHIDLAMFDALLSMMPTATCRYVTTGKVPERVGNRHALSAPFGVFRTGDGHVVVAVLNEKLFEQFCAVIGRNDLLSDPRFRSDSERTANEHLLRSAFEQWSLSRSTQDAVTALSAAGVPAAPIENVASAVESEHSRMRRLFRSASLAEDTARVPEQPAIFSTMDRGASTHVPALGEHAERIRTWLRDAGKRRTASPT
jgi:CoA:oxalate CoA-transferase